MVGLLVGLHCLFGICTCACAGVSTVLHAGLAHVLHCMRKLEYVQGCVRVHFIVDVIHW